MIAVQIHEIGAPLRSRVVADPSPGEHDVLVRITAAGICHSDAHYRAGTSPVDHLPLTPGHEVAGVIEEVGPGADPRLVGRHVCIHYLITCGNCAFCLDGREQFCTSGQMIGKHRDGGYAEYIVVPSRNAMVVPAGVSDEHAAIMMCSTATSYHALRQARLSGGETVAVIGCGGLGMSAIQLAGIIGAEKVLAVDIDQKKLELAAGLGAYAVDGTDRPAAAIREATLGRGVDVAVELIGTKQTFELAIEVLAPKGRAAVAGISGDAISVRPYPDIINREVEIIGVSDHLLSELETILDWASNKRLDLTLFVSAAVPLEEEPINAVLDQLEAGTSAVRTVVLPGRRST